MKLLLALIIVPIIAFANIGKITVLRGDVSIKRGDQTIKAKTGVELKKYDFIKTAKNGKVQIVFSDRTIFTIGKNSTLDIADYLYDEKKPKKNRAKFNVLKGAFSSITGRIGKLNKSKFKLKTKSASIGIRGTIVKANQKTVMCTQGAITVTTPNGATVRVEAGQKTDVSSGVPTAPSKITKADEKAMNVDVTQEDIKIAQEEKEKQKAKAEEATTKAVKKAVKKAAKKAAKKTAKKAEEAEEEEVKKATEEAADEVKKAAEEATKKAAEVAKKAAEEVAKEATKKAAEAAKKAAEAAKKAAEGTYTGESIATDGTIESVSVTTSTGDLTPTRLAKDGMVADDGGINKENGDVITWGHWENDPSKKYVIGKATDIKVLDDMRNYTGRTVRATYTGKAIGTVNGTDNIVVDENNKVKFDLTTGDNENSTIAGSIQFNTKNGQTWNTNDANKHSTISATVEEGSNKFSTTTVGGVGNGKAISGIITGQFYGDAAQALGGTFKLKTESDTATGVYKAIK